jgi:acyl carrier protein phosphodiesterase
VNFLAHIYLSGEDKDLMIGNFIADSIKGKDIEKYKPGIIKGIYLHRKIDFFTDQHPIVVQSRAKLHPYFSKFAGVVLDIYFDHFLARHWEQYSDNSLRHYTDTVYNIFRNRLTEFPDEVQRFFPYMEKQDWLYNYQHTAGLQRVFEGMSRRTRFQSNMETAVTVLEDNYETLEKDFSAFFPHLIQYSEQVRLEEL